MYYHSIVSTLSPFIFKRKLFYLKSFYNKGFYTWRGGLNVLFLGKYLLQSPVPHNMLIISKCFIIIILTPYFKYVINYGFKNQWRACHIGSDLQGSNIMRSCHMDLVRLGTFYLELEVIDQWLLSSRKVSFPFWNYNAMMTRVQSMAPMLEDMMMGIQRPTLIHYLRLPS